MHFPSVATLHIRRSADGGLFYAAYLFAANSAMAGNASVRGISASSFPLFTAAMFHNLGVDWACSLIGFLALGMVSLFEAQAIYHISPWPDSGHPLLSLQMPIPFLFYVFGPRLRQKSKFAPAI
jgi:DHA1 family multidrug resistance protein-like MFS transporter